MNKENSDQKNPNCKECDNRMEKKDDIYKCPNCGQQLEGSDAFLKTEKSHKDWYNVKGKLGKQRGKPKQDMDS